MLWIVLGAVVVLIGAAVLWWRFRDLGGDPYDKFTVERRWGWEMQLSEEEETAFMAGLRAYYDAGHSMFIQGEYGSLRLYQPSMLISLYVLADRFRAFGSEALANPEATVRGLLDRLAETEEPGVLHLRDDWWARDVDGMDNIQFVDVVRDAICPPGNEAITGWYSDEGGGYIQVVVLDEKPESVRAIENEAYSYVQGGPILTYREAARELLKPVDPQFEDALRRADGEASRYTNTLLVDLGRVLETYQVLRERQPMLSIADAARATVSDMIARNASGVTWIRPVTSDQRRAVLAAAGM